MTHKIRFHGVLPLFTLIAAAVLRQNLAILSAAPAVFAACLGIPFALERAHAMTFSRGRMLFNLLLAVLITAAGSALSYVAAMRVQVSQNYLLPWPAAFIVLQSCITVDLCAMNRDMLAFVLELLNSAAILLPCFLAPSDQALKLIPAAQAAVCAPGLLLSCLSGEGKKALSPSARLLAELPSALIQTLLYPCMCVALFALLPHSTASLLSGMVVAMVFYAALIPAGAVFRRQPQEIGYAVPAAAVICLAAAILSAVFSASYFMTAVGGLSFLWIACIFAEYEALAPSNLISAALALAAAFASALPISAGWICAAQLILLASILILQRDRWANLFRHIRASSIR